MVLTGCPGPVPPHLSAIESQIFAPNCTFSSCHSTFGSAAHLSLVQGKSFANLVNLGCGVKISRHPVRHYLTMVP